MSVSNALNFILTGFKIVCNLENHSYGGDLLQMLQIIRRIKHRKLFGVAKSLKRHGIFGNLHNRPYGNTGI
jgi:hypothetical protein